MVLVGAHVSTKGGIDKAVDNAVRIDAPVIQTHPTSAQQWRSLHLDDAILATYHDKYSAAHLQGHWLHAVYLINLATPKESLLNQSIGSLTHYMELARQLDAQGVVFHPGSHLGAGFDSKLAQMIEALKTVLGRSDSPARLLIENSAGSGGCVGCNFSELGRLVHGVDDPRIGVCLDTQHMFASGYDFRTPQTALATLDEFGREVGFENLALVHANDSRRELGCNVDRHANIGEGEIGVEAFRLLGRDGRLDHVPWLLEVPGHEHSGPDRQQIDTLRDCVGMETSSVAR
jgi:deoxyribonuclease-4